MLLSNFGGRIYFNIMNRINNACQFRQVYSKDRMKYWIRSIPHAVSMNLFVFSYKRPEIRSILDEGSNISKIHGKLVVALGI